MMGFSEQQQRALHRGVPQRSIRVRQSGGKELAYVEGWYAIASANRIFGFDGWDRETLETRCVLAREARGTCHAVYVARVRVTVRTGDRVIVRDGHGTGEGLGNHVGEAHDLALKAAETDATKRALVTFGRAFGLALYANGRDRRQPGPPEVRQNLAEDDASSVRGVPSLSNGDDRPHQSSDDEANRCEAAKLSDRADAALRRPVPGRDHQPGNNPANELVGPAGGGPAKVDAVVGTQGSLHRAIDKSALALAEPRRVRDKAHLRYVAAQPCLLCSAPGADAHHLRFAQPRALGRKVGDEFTVPLCRKHHRELHQSGNEAAWWHDMGIDAIKVAKHLWDETVGSG